LTTGDGDGDGDVAEVRIDAEPVDADVMVSGCCFFSVGVVVIDIDEDDEGCFIC
jgi:hypothetical protein